MLLPPSARQMFGDLIQRFFAAPVAKRSEGLGISFSGDDGADDSHTGRTGDIGDGAMHLNVHLVECLLHPLHRFGSFGNQVLSLTMNCT